MSKNLTTKDFILKARKVHGKKYDYSKVEYINNKTKICVICPTHGEFWQKPDKHLMGSGCPLCGGTKKLTKEQFISKAKEVHGDKYDYSNVEYVNNSTNVSIICKEHGEFLQSPHNHLKGKGCPQCAKNLPHPTKLDTEKFIERAKQIHGSKYDYSKVEYVDSHSNVCIICPTHGEFWQIASSHLQGCGCSKCSHDDNGLNRRANAEEFIAKSREIHSDKYDYSQINYITARNKVSIICPKHGEFWQAPYHHLQGCGCPICAGTKRLTTEEFIEKARMVHGNKYDYSKVEYKNSHKKVKIICSEHGEFLQTPNGHLNGKGCPYCQSSRLENDIVNLLTENGIKFERQKKFIWLGKQSLDFYLPEYNIAIECQGIQHFQPVEHFGGMKQFKEQQKLDSNKIKFCDLHDVKILFYTTLEVTTSYTVYDNTTDLLNVINGSEKVNNLISSNFKVDRDNFIGKEIEVPQELINFVFGLVGVENVVFNNKITDEKSVTFFIPNLNVGVCYNPLSNGFGNIFREREFNLARTDYFKQSNIKILQIFEDEFFYNKEIVFNKIMHILKCQGSYKTIMGRKTNICEISKETAKEFLTKYHIQGFAPSTIYLGAFYDGELVACMSFKKDADRVKSAEDKAWDLTRFASNYNFICQGIGGKLFKHFIRNYEFSEIKSFADRRWTVDENNNIYKQLGFEFDKYTAPEYRYIGKEEHPMRVHKFNFRIHKLNKVYGVPLTMTEREMTDYLGFTRVYDCGLIKYIYKKS